MAKASDIYKIWLTGDMLPKACNVTIEGATVESLTVRPGVNEQKIVLCFKGKQARFILNQGNANKMVRFLGDDLEGWTGGVISLTPHVLESGKFKGKKTIIVGPPIANGNGTH